MHCFHVGYVGAELNVYYDELADFFLGWAGLDICADDNHSRQAAAAPPPLGPDQDPLIGPANPAAKPPPPESVKPGPIPDPPKVRPAKPPRPKSTGLVRPP